jgi:hypothetical protein
MWTNKDRQAFKDRDILRASTVPSKRSAGPSEDEWGDDWGDDADEPIVASCDLENPESCESCQ